MMLITSLLIALVAIFKTSFQLDTAKTPIRIGVKSQAISEDSVEISFSILPGKIKCCKGNECFHQEVNAIVEQKNIGNRDINTTIELMFGLKDADDNHIETYKLNGEEVNCAREIDYHYTYGFSTETRILKQNEIIRDTIDLNSFYSFKQKGVFKVRFISREFGVASNWDTLVVK